MSVFQGKLTATEQQKTWPADKRSRGGGFECILLGTRVQVYSKVCLWLRGQEIHLGGNWNVGRLKGHDRYVSLGGGNQMTFTCSLMSLWGCAELPGRAHEKHKCARGAWHTLNGRERTQPDRLRRLKPADPCFHECCKKRAGATEDEAERWGGGADEGEAFTGFNHSKTLNSYWVIKTFYESSCSNLQHYNSVAGPK